MKEPFDLNNDGRTDNAEEYAGYQLFQSMTGKGSSRERRKPDGLVIAMAVVVGFMLLKIIAGWIY